MPNRLCLVTGASAGIGAAFAREYARHGWDVALTARRADRLRALQDEIEAERGVSALVFPADLAEPDAPARLLAEIGAAGRQVDALVANAGYGLPGGFRSNAWEDHARFLQVMVTAPTELAHRAATGMAERGFGRIVFVASLAALVPAGPGHTLYAASKAYLVKLAEALHGEVAAHGVHVTALCPGFTYSEFHDVAGTRDKVSQKTPKHMWQTAHDVAAIGYAACEANVPVRVAGAPNKGVAALAAILPDPLARRLMNAQASRFRDAR